MWGGMGFKSLILSNVSGVVGGDHRGHNFMDSLPPRAPLENCRMCSKIWPDGACGRTQCQWNRGACRGDCVRKWVKKKRSAEDWEDFKIWIRTNWFRKNEVQCPGSSHHVSLDNLYWCRFLSYSCKETCCPTCHVQCCTRPCGSLRLCLHPWSCNLVQARSAESLNKLLIQWPKPLPLLPERCRRRRMNVKPQRKPQCLRSLRLSRLKQFNLPRSLLLSLLLLRESRLLRRFLLKRSLLLRKRLLLKSFLLRENLRARMSSHEVAGRGLVHQIALGIPAAADPSNGRPIQPNVTWRIAGMAVTVLERTVGSCILMAGNVMSGQQPAMVSHAASAPVAVQLPIHQGDAATPDEGIARGRKFHSATRVQWHPRGGVRQAGQPPQNPWGNQDVLKGKSRKSRKSQVRKKASRITRCARMAVQWRMMWRKRWRRITWRKWLFGTSWCTIVRMEPHQKMLF